MCHRGAGINARGLEKRCEITSEGKRTVIIMPNPGHRATKLNLLANTGLFILKLSVGLLLLSLAIIADAINSFSDIFASLAVLVSFRVGAKQADADHPFGHSRAEPIAALIVAIFIGIVGFEIIRFGIFDILDPGEHSFNLIGVVALLVSMATKSLMFRYFKRVGTTIRSPAILASAVDSRNDVLSSAVALLGFIGTGIGYDFLDGTAALVIGVWIIYSAIQLSKENIGYLMGEKPEENMLKEIETRACSVAKVLNVHDVSAHYVGNFVHVELHITLDKSLTLLDSHDVAKKVQGMVEEMESVSRAFIHVDPDL